MNDENDLVPAEDQALSIDEAADLKRRIAALNAAKQWRWFGNFAGPFQAVGAANQTPPAVAGEAIFAHNDNGTVGLYLFV